MDKAHIAILYPRHENNRRFSTVPTLGVHFEPFMNSLIAAYDAESFARMLRLRLNKRLDLIASNTNFNHQVFQVIETAEREGWTYNLLLAARGYNPGNATLLAFANRFGLAATDTPESKSQLESVIQKSNSFLDAGVFRTLQGWVETAVCRIKVGGKPAGTGFLIGPGVVMTNHHVVVKVIDGQVAPTTVTCQFDYKRLNTGQALSEGVEYVLAAGDDWLITDTPPAPQELAGQPKTVPPSESQLDFALLRLKDDIASVQLGSGMPTTAPLADTTPRAWLPFKTDHDFAPNTPLWIMQHPKAAPLKLALDTNAVIGLNENGTRVTYRTNTDSGSSGSPVFDQNWNLVALHHMGDPDWRNPTQNEGVPVASIQNYLRSKNLLDRLGKQEL